MAFKYIQVDCTESNKLDLRQAKAVLKYKPDIVLLEYPNNANNPSIELNNYPPQQKPKQLIAERLKPFSKQVLSIHPWAKSDLIMWQNIVQLWSEGHQIFVYATDGPTDLTSEWLDVWNHMYPQATKNWVWWVQIYLRERFMANHIQYVLDNYVEKTDPLVLVFLQEFHWKHVEFLLARPTKQEAWSYYFERFNTEVSMETIGPKIKKLNPVFYSYWQQYSDFRQNSH